MSEENKTKSLDELLAKKKTAKPSDENDNMRSKMNRLKKANDIFADTKKDEIDEEQENSLKQLKEEKEKLEKELQVASLKQNEKISSLEKEIKDITSELENVKKEKENQELKVKELSDALNNQTFDQKDKALLEKEISSLNTKLEKATSDNLKQKNKNSELNEKNKNLSTDLKKEKENTKALTKEKESLLKDNNTKTTELNNLNNLVNELKEENTSLKKDLDSKCEEVSSLNEKNTLLMDVTSGLSQEFRNYEVKEVNDKQEKESLISDLEKALKEVNELNSKVSLLEKEQEEKKQELIEAKNQEEVNELQSKIDELEQELLSKNNEIEKLKDNQKPEDFDKVIDDYTLQIENRDFEITKLKEEKNDLIIQNASIEPLNTKIEELELELSETQKAFEDYKIQVENDDTKIDASVLNELKEIQAECDQAEDAKNKMEQEKVELEKELELAYTALKDQEAIIDEQQAILDEQQLVISEKFDAFEDKKKEFLLQQEEFEKEKNAYLQDVKEFNEYRKVSDEKQENLDKYEHSISELQKELDNAKEELEALVKENNILKEEKAKNEEVLKQYLEDIESSEKKINELVDTLSNKEIDLDNLKTKYNNIQNEYQDYKDTKEESIRELENQINKLKNQLNNINVDNEKLSISKFNESRLQSRIFELENNIKILSLKQANNQENSLISSLEQYRSLLASERKAHSDAEEKLVNELNNTRNQFDLANEKLEKYSSNYLLNSLSNQIININNIINDIRLNGSDMNRDVYANYYDDALRIYNEQKKLFLNEVEKRNEVLNTVKLEKEQELHALSEDPESNIQNSIAANKLRLLYKQIRDIDILISSQIKTYSPVSLDKVEEEIVKVYKKKVLAYHKQIEDNIKSIEKQFDEKYNEVKTLDELVETYQNDTNEMSKAYSKEIEKLYMMNDFDNNPLSKILREEKILLLTNEFQALVDIRDKKYEQASEKAKDKVVSDNNDEYSASLDNFDSMKKTLSEKMASIEQEANEAKGIILDEQKHINEDIEHLKDQLEQLNSFGDDEVVSEDRRKVKVLLAGKQERLDYLKTIKAVETEKHYNEMLDGIKADFEQVLAEEKASKDLYIKRSEAFKLTSKIKENTNDNNDRIKIYEEINKNLLNINNIHDVFNVIVGKRENINNEILTNNEAFKEKNANALAFVEKYQNLWKLYDKYVFAKKTMEEDFEDIRNYNNLKVEANGTYRKYVSLQKTITKLEERVKMGLDVSSNTEMIKSGQSKANTLKARVDYLNTQALDLSKNPTVSQYVELTNKIEEIITLIKQMDNDFSKYLK